MSILPHNSPPGEPSPQHPEWLAEFLRTGKPIPYDATWWEEFRNRVDSSPANTFVSRSDGCRRDSENLPPYRLRWVQLLDEFPILEKGVDGRNYVCPEGTLPDPMTPAEVVRLVGSFCRHEIAEPFVAVLGPYIANIVRAVVRTMIHHQLREIVQEMIHEESRRAS